MKAMRIPPAPVLLLVLVLASPPAWAHKLKLFVSLEGTEAVGTVYFAGGGKAAELNGQVLDATGQVVAALRTDAQGAFRFTPPDRRPLRIRFESGDGHLAETTLAAETTLGAETPPAAPRPAPADIADTAQIEAAIARQLTPLRQQIDALDSRARLSDIIGGLGLIAGLFGGWAWLAARRKDKSP